MSLRKETVSPVLLSLLQSLMREADLENFALAGGTSLALRLGHRISVDLDLFSEKPFDASALGQALMDDYPLMEAGISTNSLSGAIGGIKLDLIAHQYPLLKPFEETDGIRFFSLEDITAMKLNAIANRGSKKDFWDCAYLLDRFDLKEMLEFYEKKYPRTNLWTVERSICYFDDAESEPSPRDLNGRTWPEIKERIRACNRR